jgi:Putative transposase of IS4/5 family (DUF4096)
VAYCWYLAHGRSAARTSENSCPDNRAASTGNIGRIAVVLDGMDLTDAQWAVLEPTFRPRRRPDGRGRPWTDPRAVMNGVLWGRCRLFRCANGDVPAAVRPGATRP